MSAQPKHGKFWTDAWSLVEGCTPVSPGCERCWLQTISGRFKGGREFSDVRFREDRLSIPLRQKKPRVYAVWSDLYHEAVTLTNLADAFRVMDRCKQHTFLVITKRPESAADYCDGVLSMGPAGLTIPSNIWHIATMEDQERAEKRMHHLLDIPGNKGVIIEPMLGPIDLREAGAWKHCGQCSGGDCHDCGYGCVQQVILGGETGHGARPMDPEWAADVRDECKGAGVPFYFKSHGGRAKDGHLLDGCLHNELAWVEK